MKASFKLAFILLFVCGALGSARAQENATPPNGSAMHGPPKVLTIIREHVKPGKAGTLHEKTEAALTQAAMRSKLPEHWIGMTSLSGPDEALFLVGATGFTALENNHQWGMQHTAAEADIDRMNQADGELLSGAENMIARYREDLSYKPEVNIGQMRYFEIVTVRTRPGYGHAAEEIAKMYQSAAQKGNIDDHWAAYEVAYGAPEGTFLYFIPMKSLAEMDDAGKQKAYETAFGEEGFKKMSEIEEKSTERVVTNIYAFSPSMSYVTEELAAADPSFWHPKPMTAKKTGAGHNKTNEKNKTGDKSAGK